ncbi:MAG: O-antigen ligase family protein [Chthoniobacterales bacterium]
MPQIYRRNSHNISAIQWASNGSIALLPVLACFLGGGSQKWAEGIVTALLGLYLLVRPPGVSLGPIINCIFVALLGLATIAFLPARWFFLPAWRSAVLNDFAIPLPSTLTPQPWMTAGCLISLIAGMSWLYVVSTQEIELRSTRFQLRFFVTGIVAVAAISIALYLAHAAFPFWINQRGFGPFPNRNHTADLFGITAIVLLACGQDDIRHGRKRWLIWLMALGILVAAIILNFSRAGMVILVGGSALWIAVVALRQRSLSWIALGFSFLLLLLTVILLLGGETLERFHLRGIGGFGISTDFRWRIFRDTFRLIRASPWCGIGLGNFDAVFAIFRSASLGDTRALHPESDWLWLWAELGWPAVAVIVIGAALLIRRVLPLREGTNQRFRLAALIGAVAFALHGLLDVPGHRVGTAFAGILLLGLSLHRPLGLRPSRWIASLFRLVGLLLVVSGASWAVAALGKTSLPGTVGVANAKELSAVANRDRNFAETVSLTNRALVWAPLDWQLYFLRALGEVGEKQPASALDDFRRARFLEPNAYEVPLVEGNVWLSSRPILAATAWQEALRRADPEQRPEVYSSMLSNASMRSPQVSRILEETGLRQHDLALAYLSRVFGALFNHALTEFLKHDPNLATLTEPEKLALFSLWSERGDLEQLAQAVQQHPGWITYAWLGMATYNASKQDFRAAYELTQRFGEAVALPRISAGSSLEDLQKRFYTAPDNYAVGYALYREQVRRGRIDDSLLTARHFSEWPNAPAYFHFLEAQSWAEKQNWERAWNAWQKFQSAKTRAGR